LNLNIYKYFNEVAATGSIRRVADRLHVAPSAISRQIALLEHTLGVMLLERFTRKMCRDLIRGKRKRNGGLNHSKWLAN
jgi:DNA-binding transcriptional LysR family regulator